MLPSLIIFKMVYIKVQDIIIVGTQMNAEYLVNTIIPQSNRICYNLLLQ